MLAAPRSSICESFSVILTSDLVHESVIASDSVFRFEGDCFADGCGDILEIYFYFFLREQAWFEESVGGEPESVAVLALGRSFGPDVFAEVVSVV